MEAKDTLTKVLKALIEIKDPIKRQPLLDFLVGKEGKEAQDQKWDDMETYGIADSHDEEFLANLVDAAMEAGFIKPKPAKSEYLVVSAAGKKFAKKPTSFEMSDEDEMGGDPTGGDQSLDDILDPELIVHRSESNTSARTKLQIKLIKAIDRKIALDDFAEAESLGLDEVLDELENMIRQGKKLDITYFTDEVLGESCVDELIEFFEDEESDDLDNALNEYGDVYNPEEIRLARLVYRCRRPNSKV